MSETWKTWVNTYYKWKQLPTLSSKLHSKYILSSAMSEILQQRKMILSSMSTVHPCCLFSPSLDGLCLCQTQCCMLVFQCVRAGWERESQSWRSECMYSLRFGGVIPAAKIKRIIWLQLMGMKAEEIRRRNPTKCQWIIHQIFFLFSINASKALG